MKGILASLLLTVTLSTSAWGQSEEMLGYWQDTGYGVAELLQEEDFLPEVCISEVRYYSACLMTLNSLLGSIEGQNYILKFNGLNEFEIIARTEEQLPKTYEEYTALSAQLRADFALAYQFGLAASYADLLLEVQTMVMENILPTHQPWAAGTAFTVFLEEAYDPHSYLIPREAQIPKPSEYFGIGSTISKVVNEESQWNGMIALDPMAGSPALYAGLKKGDLISKIDGLSVLEESVSDAVERIKGPEGTTVTFEIQRLCSGELETVEVVRGPIVNFSDWTKDSHFVSLVNSDEKAQICADEIVRPQPGEPQALYVPLARFVEARGQDLCNEFVDLQLKDLRNPDSVGMIIDLRNNGGGSLAVVSCMLDSIIDDDGLMIGQVSVEKGEIIPDLPMEQNYLFHHRAFLNSNGQGFIYNKNIVVLVNGGSASASEIFAGTIQDMQRGFVVGEQTFGKGSMQALRPHAVASELQEPSDSLLVLASTIGIYTLNSGRSPQNFGIVPDFAYTSLGEVPEARAADSGEAGRFRSIQYDSAPWTQTRPELVSQMQGCAASGNSQTELFRSNIEQDESYRLPFVANFQMSMAKDVLRCAPEREVVATVETINAN